MLEQQLLELLVFFRQNPVVALIIGIVVALCFYTKPKESLKLLAFALFLVAAFYLITLFAGTVGSGAKQKDQMIYKSKEVLGE